VSVPAGKTSTRNTTSPMRLGWERRASPQLYCSAREKWKQKSISVDVGAGTPGGKMGRRAGVGAGCGLNGAKASTPPKSKRAARSVKACSATSGLSSR